ncbi:uncharacterized protein LOC111696686 isoform X2 [Eurytemora carolleeae]|uniref:uncharacterized protein LOC111696686 isoform X2 n=1 Tax=Eurytemora carolleeae TaxID=1294199 RepID=UPI000C766978|nr:uncharacterized protein LOC111696686 isoform X2 [Eurytemora carolleeae]|eukprot:XP_023322149.1 uncharacterized protein LOC111696686 isoform X2 [Eurytemora affinis]
MCTVKEGEKGVHTFFSSINPENQTVNVSNDPGLGQAKELFFLLSAKEGDYRCLNPDSDKDPTKWKIYDPVLLANATTKDELNKVPSYTFKMNDNVVNPELIKQLTGDDYEKNWKKYYGVDFVSRGEDLGEVVLDCYKAQKSDFAKNCRKNKGLFKCCASGSSFDTFQHLRKAGNLSTSAYDKLCPNKLSCRISISHHLCSSLDPFTNLVHLEFKTPIEGDFSGILIPNAEANVGIASNTTYLDIRPSATECVRMDTCLENYVIYNNILEFLKASDKKSLCKLDMESHPPGNITIPKHIKKINNTTSVQEVAETYSDCLKRKYPSFRICPEKMFNAKKANEDGFILYKSAMSKLWKKNKKKKKEKKKSKRRKSKKKKRKNKKKRKKDENKKKRKKKVKCSTKHKK